MLIRLFQNGDVARMRNITKDYPLPTPSNIIIGRAVEHEGKLAGYGVVKHMGEAIFTIDETLPKITRAKALKALMKIAIYGARSARCEQLHVFVKDRKLADSLIKHYGFVETNDIVLAKGL